MIIVKLTGGLGNQMFQYAAAKALAMQAGAPLKLDITHFKNPLKNETGRAFRLDVFPGVNEEFATADETSKIISNFRVGLLNRLYRQLLKAVPAINRAYIVEGNLCYSPIRISTTEDAFLDGYWQSAKYFNSIESIIRSSFNLTHLNETLQLQPMIRLIQSGVSVGIHVRRGDYATNPSANAYHGLLSQHYYNRSIKLMLELVAEEARFFIFSDDIEWCERNLSISANHFYVESEQDYQDLYLMSLCTYNIIANSSFSWWGAWLNQHPDKMVIAPENWFTGDIANEIVPVNWKRVSNKEGA